MSRMTQYLSLGDLSLVDFHVSCLRMYQDFLLRLNVSLWKYLFLFIHPSMEGHVDCFHLLAIANNTAMNMGVYLALQVPAFNYFEYVPQR